MIRRILFWAHLVAGVIAGLAIGIMCFTGAALAFEKDLVAWAERDARRVTVPADATRLPLAVLGENVRAFAPDAKPLAITVAADPAAAVTFSLGRDHAVYANPYTGEVRRPASTRMHDFMHVMEDWHRWLALGGDNRPIGKAINGACNLAFFFLAVSGLYLWWPRQFTWRSVKAVALFNGRLTGKARDFNWHNAIGLWTAPILIVLTLTAVPISYRWATNTIYRMTGETPPASPGPGGAAGPVVALPPPPPGAKPLSHDALLAAAAQAAPGWESLTLRLGSPNRGPRPGATAAEAPATPPERKGPQAVAVTVREPNAWPRTAATTLSLDPFTGDILRREGQADLSAARQIRGWMRYLHTGEALGFWGQLVAGLASLGGCVLVYTGFALAWRRFVPAKQREG